VQPEVGHTALAHIARLYRIERDAKELIGPDGLKSEQAWLFCHHQRLALRQQHSRPLLAEFRQCLQATEQTVLPGTAAAVLYSVLPSSKANQVEPFACVRDLLVQLSGHSPPAAAALFPDAWPKAHLVVCRSWSR